MGRNDEPVAPTKREVQFEKYVAKKMKKENRSELYERLQTAAFTSDQLQSTKNLASKKKTSLSNVNSNKDSHEEEYSFKEPRRIKEIKTVIPVDEFVMEKVFKSDCQPESKEHDSTESKEYANNESTESFNYVDYIVSNPSTKPAVFVEVQRDPEIQRQREQLPIYGLEQEIIESIRRNLVVMVCGATGSGKTTQIPQFLYENGFSHPNSDFPGLIGVTQPRRVAAISVARRVGVELGSDVVVGHQVRFDSGVGLETRIKFMTDGILLREIASDFALSKYSVIVIDEAHERNLNGDILVGMLSRIVRVRAAGPSPLRLVIMSATLDVAELRRPALFSPPPPLIEVPSRQHPVTVHFARHTEADYLQHAYRTICKIHSRLPSGAILVFLTGKQEIQSLQQLLQNPKVKQHIDDLDEEDIFVKDDFEDGDSPSKDELKVLPLYSLLSPEEQMRVFEPVAEGTRLCVLATNIAETSLTIPGVRYVVDCGMVKQRIYDPATGVQRHEVVWASRASAEQRSGRAGRTGPGHCYRLFSAAVFAHQFADFSPPEVLRAPVEELVLSLKDLGVDRIEKFPLPTPVPIDALRAAEARLTCLAALTKDGKITVLGKHMTALPLTAPWARMVVRAVSDPNYKTVVALVVALAATLSVGDPFELEAKSRPPLDKRWPSELLSHLKITLQYMEAFQKAEFCKENRLLPKKMSEISMQITQLNGIVSEEYSVDDLSITSSQISSKQNLLLVKLIAESLAFNQAELVPNIDADRKRSLPMYKFGNQTAYLHPSSSLKKAPPKHIVFMELSQSTSEIHHLKYITAIDPLWINK